MILSLQLLKLKVPLYTITCTAQVEISKYIVLSCLICLFLNTYRANTNNTSVYTSDYRGDDPFASFASTSDGYYVIHISEGTSKIQV